MMRTTNSIDGSGIPTKKSTARRVLRILLAAFFVVLLAVIVVMCSEFPIKYLKSIVQWPVFIGAP